MDPRRDWSQSAEGRPVVQRWHDAGEFFLQRTQPGNFMDLGRDWSPPAEERPAVRKWRGRNGIEDFKNHKTRKKTAAERRSRTTAGANAAQPLKVNGSASWSVFRRQLETIAEQKQWSHREKSMCLVTSPKRQTADMLHGTMRDRRSSNWTLWRGRPPPKRRK
jgi:hypothetical protein